MGHLARAQAQPQKARGPWPRSVPLSCVLLPVLCPTAWPGPWPRRFWGQGPGPMAHDIWPMGSPMSRGMSCGMSSVLCPMGLSSVLWPCPMSYGPVLCPMARIVAVVPELSKIYVSLSWQWQKYQRMMRCCVMSCFQDMHDHLLPKSPCQARRARWSGLTARRATHDGA